MNKEEPYRDQAERLKRRIEKINEQSVDGDHLPPREQIHRQKRKKTKIKLKYPVIRLLVLFFILLPIIYFSVISYLDGKKINQSIKTTGDSVGSEPIHIENNKHNTKSDPEIEPETNQQAIPETTTVNSTTNSQQSEEKQDGSVPTEATNQKSAPTGGSNTANQSPGTSGTSSTNNSNVSGSSEKVPAERTTKIIYYTVKPNETLFRIAIKYFNSADGVNVIKKANHLTSDEISAGQVLKIPIKN